jgi:acyl carrier protein phosphodiesterase
MNYLAHSFLSFSSEPVLFGQFIADDIKGSKWQQFEKSVQTGILLHRFIDDYTDSHPLLLELKKQLYPTLGKFSGVVLDVLFDHVLSQNWHHYSEQMRETWIQSTYSLLQKRQAEMTDKRRFIAEKMIEHDWMNMYKTEDGTSRILNQMSLRIPFANPLKDSFQIYRMHEKDIISTFQDFFPQILWATQNKLDTFAP